MKRVVSVAAGGLISVAATVVLGVRLPGALDQPARAERVAALTAELRDAESEGDAVSGQADDAQASLDAMNAHVARLRKDARAQRKQISKLEDRVTELGG